MVYNLNNEVRDEHDTEWHLNIYDIRNEIIQSLYEYLSSHNSLYISKVLKFEEYYAHYADVILITIKGPIIYNTILGELGFRKEYISYSQVTWDCRLNWDDYIHSLVVDSLNEEI